MVVRSQVAVWKVQALELASYWLRRIACFASRYRVHSPSVGLAWSASHLSHRLVPKWRYTRQREIGSPVKNLGILIYFGDRWEFLFKSSNSNCWIFGIFFPFVTPLWIKWEVLLAWTWESNLFKIINMFISTVLSFKLNFLSSKGTVCPERLKILSQVRG